MFLLIVTEARTKQRNKEACRSQLSLTLFVAGRKYARPGLGTSVLQAVVIVSYCDPSLGDTPLTREQRTVAIIRVTLSHTVATVATVATVR